MPMSLLLSGVLEEMGEYLAPFLLEVKEPCLAFRF